MRRPVGPPQLLVIFKTRQPCHQNHISQVAGNDINNNNNDNNNNNNYNNNDNDNDNVVQVGSSLPSGWLFAKHSIS